jgi:multidrug resistance efflux pump
LTRLDDYRAGVRQQELDMDQLEGELAFTRLAQAQKLAAAKASLDKADLDLRTLPVRSDIDSERLRLTRDEAEAAYKQLLSEVPHNKTNEEAQIRNEKFDLEQARLELRRAEQNVEKMVVKAPIDGIVVMQSMRRGQETVQVQAGDQIGGGQPYMQIVDPSAMVVEANVNQVDVEHLRIGQKATVRFDAYPDLQLPAHVYSIGAVTKPGGPRASFVKEIPVKLRIDRMDDRVIPDLTVSADVVLQEEQAAAVVPAGAVFQEQGGKPFVFVQGANGFEKREVVLGVSSAVQVSVRSGVKPGEVVALEWPVAMLTSRKDGDQKEQ